MMVHETLHQESNEQNVIYASRNQLSEESNMSSSTHARLEKPNGESSSHRVIKHTSIKTIMWKRPT